MPLHMQGEPRTMQDDPRYDDVVAEVKAFLEERLAFAVREGIAEERVWLDPGIGFGKTLGAQPRAAAPARRDRRARAPGRDRGLPQAVHRNAHRQAGADRAAGTVAANVLAFERGAHMFRVHDVAPTRDALAVAAATVGESRVEAPDPPRFT